MFIFTLGITALLAKLLPVGWLANIYLVQNSSIIDIPRQWVFTFSTITSYIAALIVAVLFVNGAHLRERLPKSHPGTPMTLIGLTLLIISLLPMFYLFNFTPVFSSLLSTVSSIAILLGFIAHFLILMGIVQTMLRIEPHHAYWGQKLVQTDTPQNPQELDPEWMEKTFGRK